MARLPVIAAAVFAVAASAPVICTTTNPASAQGWRDSDGDMNRDLRDLLVDRIRSREDLRDFIKDVLEERGGSRERMHHWRDREDEDEGGWRGGRRERMGHWREDEDEGDWRGRLRERIAERRRGGEEGECYFLTRSLRDEDGDFLVLVSRRVCRD
jgi:hypothetical protein